MMKEEIARKVLHKQVDEFMESDYPMTPELSRLDWLKAFAHYLEELADELLA
jgi:hypothetical protein